MPRRITRVPPILPRAEPVLSDSRTGVSASNSAISTSSKALCSIVCEGLIVVQVALSVLLLGAGGLLVRSFSMLYRGPGFDRIVWMQPRHEMH